MVLAFTQGNPNEEMFAEYIDYTEKMFRLLEFDVKDVVVVAGTRNEPASEQVGLQSALKAVGLLLTEDWKIRICGSVKWKKLEDINACLSISPNGALRDDLKYIQSKLSYYYEIPKNNYINLDFSASDCFTQSKRTVNELSKIVFDNENPMGYNERYYSMTKTLEGPEAIQQ